LQGNRKKVKYCWRDLSDLSQPSGYATFKQFCPLVLFFVMEEQDDQPKQHMFGSATLTGPNPLRLRVAGPRTSCWTWKRLLWGYSGPITGKKFSRGGLMEKYIAAYESWREEMNQTMEESEFAALKSNLESCYWSN
jgi:hypothetical protein